MALLPLQGLFSGLDSKALAVLGGDLCPSPPDSLLGFFIPAKSILLFIHSTNILPSASRGLLGGDRELISMYSPVLIPCFNSGIS